MGVGGGHIAESQRERTADGGLIYIRASGSRVRILSSFRGLSVEIAQFINSLGGHFTIQFNSLCYVIEET